MGNSSSVPIEDFKYLRTIVLPFIKEHGDKRISKTSIEYYKNFTIHRPESDEVIVSEVEDGGVTKAISIACIKNGSFVTFSTTVTHKDYRKKGFGKACLEDKVNLLNKRGLSLKSVVAEDNVSGMALCKKVGLGLIEMVSKMRATGPYNAAVWKNK